MRVRKSAIGSVMCSLSPGRLRDAGQAALEGELAETEPAEAELAVDGARPAALHAPCVGADGKLRLAPGLRDDRGGGQCLSLVLPEGHSQGAQERPGLL